MTQQPPNIPIPAMACQDLLKKQDVFCGWLRRRKRIHKCGETIDGLFKKTHLKALTDIIPWERRYVLLDDGFLYVYDNETSRRPLKVIDLVYYQSVVKLELFVKDVPWPFKIASKQNMKDVLFGATSETDQQRWLEALQKEIGVAEASGRTYIIQDANPVQSQKDTNKITSRRLPVVESDDEEDCDYDEIPSEVEDASESSNMSTSDKSRQPLPQIPAVPPSYSNNEDESIYEPIDMGELPKSPNSKNSDRAPILTPRSTIPVPRPTDNSTTTGRPQPDAPKSKAPALPLTSKPSTATVEKPPVPMKTQVSTGNTGKKTPPAIKTKVTPFRKSEDNDDEGVEYELEDQPNIVKQATWTGSGDGVETMKTINDEGVFMLRTATSGNGEQTLQVVTSNGVLKKYKITTEDTKFKIGGTPFGSMTELIEHYQKNPLPTCSTKLTKPYKNVAQK